MAGTSIARQKTVWISRAEYDARKLAGTLENNTIYNITKDTEYVPKRTASADNQSFVYAYDSNGERTFQITSGAVAGTVAYRGDGGSLKVGYPNSFDDAAPKGYVDSIRKYYVHNIHMSCQPEDVEADGKVGTMIKNQSIEILLTITNDSDRPCDGSISVNDDDVETAIRKLAGEDMPIPATGTYVYEEETDSDGEIVTTKYSEPIYAVYVPSDGGGVAYKFIYGDHGVYHNDGSTSGDWTIEDVVF